MLHRFESQPTGIVVLLPVIAAHPTLVPEMKHSQPNAPVGRQELHIGPNRVLFFRNLLIIDGARAQAVKAEDGLILIANCEVGF